MYRKTLVIFNSILAVKRYGAFQRWKKTHLDVCRTIVSQKKEQEWNLFIFHGPFWQVISTYFVKRERLESGLFKWMKKWNRSILILHFQFSYWQKALLSLFLWKRKFKMATLNLVPFFGTLLLITLSSMSFFICEWRRILTLLAMITYVPFYNHEGAVS